MEIVKKHANDWKFLTLNGLVMEELRAIRANLPQFARSQIRQVYLNNITYIIYILYYNNILITKLKLAWCQRLDDMIDKLEKTPQIVMPPRPATTKKTVIFAPNPNSSKGSAVAAKSFLLDQIKSRAHQ